MTHEMKFGIIFGQDLAPEVHKIRCSGHTPSLGITHTPKEPDATCTPRRRDPSIFHIWLRGRLHFFDNDRTEAEHIWRPSDHYYQLSTPEDRQRVGMSVERGAYLTFRRR